MQSGPNIQVTKRIKLTGANPEICQFREIIYYLEA